MFSLSSVRWSCALILCLVISSCSDKDGDESAWRNEAELTRLRGEFDLASFRVSQLPPVSAQPEPLDIASVRSEIGELDQRKQALAARISSMRDGWLDYRKNILAVRRTQVVGMRFETLDTEKGSEFTDVEIARITDGGVSVRHPLGAARLSVDDLTEAEHAFFGLDPVFADEVYRKEMQLRLAHERAVNTALKAEMAEISEREKSETQTRPLPVSTPAHEPSVAGSRPEFRPRTYSSSFSVNRRRTSPRTYRRYHHHTYYVEPPAPCPPAPFYRPTPSAVSNFTR